MVLDVGVASAFLVDLSAAAGGVAGTYRLLRQFKLSADAAFYGASYFALTPSLVGFLPQADQAHALLGCILLIIWLNAIRRGSRWLAIAFGAMLTCLVIIT